MDAWRNDLMKDMDVFDRIIYMLASGNDETLERLTWQRSHSQIAKTYISKLING
ncbi:MAG: hypothetical protein ABJ387_03450 [Balneola sp.]